LTGLPDWFGRSIERIDELNGQDPRRMTLAGESGPQELLMGRRAAFWLGLLDPAAAPEQLVAARAHHLRRWLRPRTDYPEGRAGYLRWRADAKVHHAAELAGIMEAAGAPARAVERTGSLVRKEHLRTDPAAGAHEDALCLTFLEAQLDDTAERLGDDALVPVLTKTMRKMTASGLALVGEIELSGYGRALIERGAAGLGEQ